MSNGLAVAERRSILTITDVDQAIIDIKQIVAQAVDTDSNVVSARQSLATARAFLDPDQDRRRRTQNSL